MVAVPLREHPHPNTQQHVTVKLKFADGAYSCVRRVMRSMPGALLGARGMDRRVPLADLPGIATPGERGEAETPDADSIR